MIFDRFPVASAAGVILAHSTPVAGTKFKKGRVLSEDDLVMLAEAGISDIAGARLQPGDVHEDEAANALATAATGTGVRAAEAFTGRANLISEGAVCRGAAPANFGDDKNHPVFSAR